MKRAKNPTSAGKAGGRSRFQANVGVHPMAPAVFEDRWLQHKKPTAPIADMKMGNLAWVFQFASAYGLFNRRFMEESLDLELRRAARNQRPLGVIEGLTRWP